MSRTQDKPLRNAVCCLRRSALCYHRRMEVVFRAWFLLSLATGALSAGWLLSHGTSVTWQVVALLCVPMLVLASVMRSMSTRPSLVRSAATAVFLASVFLPIGSSVEKTNAFRVNAWARNSLKMLAYTIDPVQHFSDPSNDPLLQIDEGAKKADSAAFQWNQEGHILGDLLVSFSSGLARIADGEVHYLTTKNLILTSQSLLPDGSFLTYQPSGNTLSRMRIVDETLRTIWTNGAYNLGLHHWGDEFGGKVYQPGRIFVDLPNPVSVAIGGMYAECEMAHAPNDAIYIFDAQSGMLEHTINVMERLAAMGREGDVIRREINACIDATHLNDVQVLKTKRAASFFPNGKIGDLLISMRKANAVVLLDRDSYDVKWFVTEGFRMQHSPRVTGHGTVVIFDNLSSDRLGGRSRIVEIDIATKEIVGTWEGTDDIFFDTSRRGKVTLLGDDILVMDQEGVIGKDNELFLLDCPAHPISQDCRKVSVFVGSPPGFQYDNVVLLEESKALAGLRRLHNNAADLPTAADSAKTVE